MNKDIDYVSEKNVGIVYPQHMKGNNDFAWKKIDGQDVDIMDLKEKYKIVESAILIRKKLLVEYPFPIIDDEKFIQEGWLYQKLSLIGKFVVNNNAFYISEYYPDGLTRNMWRLWANNSEGTLLYLNDKFRALKKYTITLRIIARAKCVINIHTICFKTNKSILKKTPSRFYSLILFLPSIYFYKARFN